MKKKILISILIILILLLFFAFTLYKILNTNENNYKASESKKMKLDNDMYTIENINNMTISFESLEFSNIIYKNENNKSIISLNVRNVSSSVYTIDDIKIELYNSKNSLIGYIILSINKDISPDEEISLSQEVEFEIKDVYSIKFSNYSEEDLTSKEQQILSETDDEKDNEPKYDSDEEVLKMKN